MSIVNMRLRFARPLFRYALIQFVVGSALLLCFAGAAMACPTCKDSLGNDPATAGMVNGYFWSILFMMSMPFIVFFGVGGYFYWEICRARRERAAALFLASS